MENVIIPLSCSLELCFYNTFVSCVEKLFIRLLALSEQGFSEPFFLFYKARIEGEVRGNVPTIIKRFFESHRDIDLTNLANDVDALKIQKSLSPVGKRAWESAEFLFAKSTECGERDAGMLSLSYYRILELELNSRFVLPWLKPNAESFRKCFERWENDPNRVFFTENEIGMHGIALAVL